jgi:hypothetical protein
MTDNIWSEGNLLTLGPLDDIVVNGEGCGSCVGDFFMVYQL